MVQCVAVIDSQNAPLLVECRTSDDWLALQFQVHCSVDVLEERLSQQQPSASQQHRATDIKELYTGLLLANENFGYATNTKVKFIIVVELTNTLKDQEMRVIFKRLHSAYCDTVCSPFYIPSLTLNQSQNTLQKYLMLRVLCRGINNLYQNRVQSRLLLMPFYAVAFGRETGVFTKWDQCKEQVDGFTGARYKKFQTIEEAELFVSSKGQVGGAAVHGKKPYERPAKVKTSDADASKATETPKVEGEEESADTNAVDTNGNEYVNVYTDGSCLFNGQNGALAGMGIHWPQGQMEDQALPLDGRPTNNHAEITAVSEAIRQALKNDIKHLRIHTDSQFLIDCVTKWMAGWKKKNWRTAKNEPVKNELELKELDGLLCELSGVQWQHVRGHEGVAGNEKADALSREGAAKNVPKK